MPSEPMPSEWLQVMLEEIARKQAEADAARRELERRLIESGQPAAAAPPDPRGAHAPATG